MSIHPFGQTVYGEAVDEVRLALDSGVSASFIPYGAIWRDMLIPVPGSDPRHVVLGFKNFAGYAADRMYVGATLGRVANRISNGRFTLDGKTYELPLTEKGRTHLHGGVQSFSKRVWTIDSHDDSSISMSLISPDGEEGYPGEVTAYCIYRLLPPATIRLEMGAKTDAPTVVNLVNHSYFSLDHGKSIRSHRLKLNASNYTPSDEFLLPTGEIKSVEGTVYDFREPKPLLHPSGDDNFMFDMNFVLDRKGDGLEYAATAEVPSSPIKLEIFTTEPALQLYDASGMAPGHTAIDGTQYFKNAGFCLEAQHFPDSPNRPEFPSIVLRPGQPYATVTEYRFSVV